MSKSLESQYIEYVDHYHHYVRCSLYKQAKALKPIIDQLFELLKPIVDERIDFTRIDL